MKNEINMGSDILSLYMENYDEGKNDDVEEIVRTKKPRKMSTKDRVSKRRKQTFFKSEKRMKQLSAVAFDPAPEHKAVIQGMLKSHQLPLSGYTSYDNPCGSSIGNKRRADTADQKMKEAALIPEIEMV